MWSGAFRRLIGFNRENSNLYEEFRVYQSKLDQIRNQLENALIVRLTSLGQSGKGKGDPEWEETYGSLHAVVDEFYVFPKKNKYFGD